MLSRISLDLISESTTTNSIGDSIKSKTYRKVFGDQLDVGQTEFYQAAATDLQPELKFKIRQLEYSKESTIRFPASTGIEYKIIRTFSPDQEFIELTCQGLVPNG